MALPAKIIERFNKRIRIFQDALQRAKDADRNESDTVAIITDILADVFGYDKYMEVTSELAIRGTYCDLAIKMDGKFQYLIECKSVGTELKENHLKQAADYGANSGIPWIVLTNGIEWQIHKIRFEQPISHELVCNFNLLQINPRKEEDQDKLFLLCKEGLSKDSREDYYEKMQCLNRFVIGGFILSEPVINVIRKELRKFAEGLKVDNEEIEKIIRQEVLKREILEGEDASKTQAKIRRFYKKQLKEKEACACVQSNISENVPQQENISSENQQKESAQ
ncbi:type I restriction enzyme HsdR N-terminal domain-containing protein [Candidatus Avelusimicrobium faecicola]|uniref:type I restriction enzyme HsdR N-terminal domain-containing protein n=1 Tax=Candidatus Avelusimicrobium faecicola TaxID=3416205 RepID=UPI003D0EC647